MSGECSWGPAWGLAPWARGPAHGALHTRSSVLSPHPPAATRRTAHSMLLRRVQQPQPSHALCGILAPLTRRPCFLSLPSSRRGQGHEGAAAAELAPAGSSAAAAAVEGPVRMKYRSTLTEENVAYLNKLDQYSSRPDSSGAQQPPPGAREAAPRLQAPSVGAHAWCLPRCSGLRRAPRVAPETAHPAVPTLCPPCRAAATPLLQSGYGGGWRAQARPLTTRRPAWVCPPSPRAARRQPASGRPASAASAPASAALGAGSSSGAPSCGPPTRPLACRGAGGTLCPLPFRLLQTVSAAPALRTLWPGRPLNLAGPRRRPHPPTLSLLHHPGALPSLLPSLHCCFPRLHCCPL